MTSDVLGTLTVFLNVDMKAFTAKMQLAKGEISGLNKAIIASSAVFKKVGKQFMIAGALITGALALTVKAAADFETSMAKVNTMLNESTEHYLPKFAKQIHNLSMKYGQSTKVLADATYDILSAQIDASKAMDLLAVASEAAAGGFTTVSTTTSAIITLMSTFGDQLRDSADAADWLAAVVERGRVTMEDVASTIGQTAAMAAKARMSIEDYGAAFAMLTRGGLDAHKAQTALRGILRSVLKTSDEAIEAARQLGIEWGVDALSAENFADTLQKLSAGTVEQLAAISPNIRGLLGWSIAAGQANESGKDLNVILNRLGLSHEKYLKVQNTLTLKLSQMKQQLIVSAQVIGEKLIPVAIRLVEHVTSLTEKITFLSRELPRTTEVLLKFTGAFGGLLILLGGLLIIIPKVLIGFTAFKASTIALAENLWLLNAAGNATQATLAKLSVVAAGLFVGWQIGMFLREFEVFNKLLVKNQEAVLDGNEAAEKHAHTLKILKIMTDDYMGAVRIYNDELSKGATFQEALNVALAETNENFKSQSQILDELEEKKEAYDAAVSRMEDTKELKIHLAEFKESTWTEKRKKLNLEYEKNRNYLLTNNLTLEAIEEEHNKKIEDIKAQGLENELALIAAENVAYKKQIEYHKTTNEELKLLDKEYILAKEKLDAKRNKAIEDALKPLREARDKEIKIEEDRLKAINDIELEIFALRKQSYLIAVRQIEAKADAFRKFGVSEKLILEYLTTAFNELAESDKKATDTILENRRKLTQSFLEVIDPQRAAYAQLAEEMKKIEETDLTTLEKAQYLAKRKAEIEKDAIDETYDYYKEASERTYNAISDSFKTLFLDAFEGNLKTARDYFNAFASSVKSIVADILAQTVAMKLLGLNGTGGLLGGLFHSGGVVKKHMGGIIKAHNGMAITADEVPIIAQTGEGVLSRLGMDALGGKSALDNLNRGNPTQTKQEIHRHYYINAMDAKSFKDFLNNNKQSLEDVISDSFDENSTLRRL
jgi:TP901 family phage tail tape measure protein